jgi:hypothetical protein
VACAKRGGTAGFGETGQKAVWFWLDRVRRDAPKSHLQTHLIEGSDGTEELFSVEILDICGLSAEYCRKCEADETATQAAKPPAEDAPQPPDQPPSGSLVPDAEIDGEGHSPDQVTFLKGPRFEHQYPSDFPDAEQLSIENARFEANRILESKGVHTYDEHRSARTEWFWQVVSAAAMAIGRVGATLQWGANRRREMLLDFGFKAAQSAGIAGRDGVRFSKLCESEKWRVLDDRLLRPASNGDRQERHNATGASGPSCEIESGSQVGTAEAVPSQKSLDAEDRRNLQASVAADRRGPNITNERNEETVQGPATAPETSVMPAAPLEALPDQPADLQRTLDSSLLTTPERRKTPEQVILEYKVLNKIRTHELVAEKLGLERSVYFELKAGRRVSAETYVKAALAIGCSPNDLKPPPTPTD